MLDFVVTVPFLYCHLYALTNIQYFITEPSVSGTILPFLLRITYLALIHACLQIHISFVLAELEQSISERWHVFLLMGIDVIFGFVLLKLYDSNCTEAESFSKIFVSHWLKWLIHRTHVPTSSLANVKFFSRSGFTSWFLGTVLQSEEQVFLEEIFDYRASTKNIQETCCDAKK